MVSNTSVSARPCGDIPGDDINAFGAAGLCGFEHGVGFTDPGRRAEKDLQPAAPAFCSLFLDTRQ
ncbi:MAG TPA: hypothetical protein VE131_14185 [Terriglobales bacterium]|nr:hypothetical protein [Terriglobales bacterium]